MGEALRLAVDDYVDVALTPARHRLRSVDADAGEAQPLQDDRLGYALPALRLTRRSDEAAIFAGELAIRVMQASLIS
jgi:hypothetical protein